MHLLGELEVIADDGSALPVRGNKQRALLAVLALHRGEALSADRLIDLLWADDPPGNPVNALQALVANLRRALGANAVSTSDAGYALAVVPQAVDVVRFEQLVTKGRRDLDAGEAADAAAALRAALALRRGEPLAEFAFAEFADGERARLEELMLLAIEGRVEADLALGQHSELVGELESFCLQHPLRERLWELRMLALYRSGRQADALRVYSEARERLIDELGLEPGPALRELEGRVLAQDPTLDAPLARTPSPSKGSPGNLRASLTSFVGRESDIERLLASLESHRLVTLIGPGGSGKTRLAIEVAARLQPACVDGAWLVELAGVRDADGVAPAMYAALRGVESAPEADRVGDPMPERLVRQLTDKLLVVVLDNCEHVIAEAAYLADLLTGRLPGLRLVATSREALGVPGELLVAVRGLEREHALQMFEDRAQAVRSDFVIDASNESLVDDVCRRLDGLPLALELAAARLRALPLPQLAERLDDRFRVLTGGARTALPRQQTLRAVVDWSYDLLFADERRLFDRLSVFTGGCDLEAVERVCADDTIAREDVLDLLTKLVDKSLVVADLRRENEARYSQLQTLWQYGRERLADNNDATEVRDRHARWYLDVARQARSELRGPDGQTWHARLDVEMDNLRAALDWFADRNDPESALFLVDGIAWSWFARNDPHEAVRWLNDALAVDGPVPSQLRATGNVWRSYYLAGIDGPLAGLDELQAAIDELRKGDHTHRLCEALLVLAELYNRANEVESSLAAVEEMLTLVDQTGDRWLFALGESLVSRDLAHLGRLDEAETAARSSIGHLKEIGQDWMVFEGLGLLSLLLEARGDLDGAAEAYHEMLDRLQGIRLTLYADQWTMRLATVRARQGRDEEANALFVDYASRVGVPANVAWSLIGQAGAVRRLGDLDSARRLLDEAEAIYDAIGSKAGRVATDVARCWWALASGELEVAAGFAAAAAERGEKCSDLLIRVAARTALAAVALVGSPSPEASKRWDAAMAERAQFAAGVYVALIGGAMSATLDEPDVAALAATSGSTGRD